MSDLLYDFITDAGNDVKHGLDRARVGGVELAKARIRETLREVDNATLEDILYVCLDLVLSPPTRTFLPSEVNQAVNAGIRHTCGEVLQMARHDNAFQRISEWTGFESDLDA